MSRRAEILEETLARLEAERLLPVTPAPKGCNRDGPSVLLCHEHGATSPEKANKQLLELMTALGDDQAAIDYLERQEAD